MLMACLNGDGCVAKMELKQYVVDAFTQQLFAGNPAAVVVLDAFKTIGAPRGESNTPSRKHDQHYRDPRFTRHRSLV